LIEIHRQHLDAEKRDVEKRDVEKRDVEKRVANSLRMGCRFNGLVILVFAARDAAVIQPYDWQGSGKVN